MTTEEEKRKKEKNHTKKQASLPKTKNCAVGDERLAEVKREKKKNKYVEAVAIEKESMDGYNSKEEKKKKKKRKIVGESLNDASGSDVIDEHDKVSTKKKKKKKQFADHENQVEATKSVVEEGDKKLKEKKVKHKSVQIQSENVKVEMEEWDVGQAGNNEVQKKEKKNHVLFVNKEEIEEQVKEKTKKKKKSSAIIEVCVTEKKDERQDKTTEGDELKVKKKKKGKHQDKSKVETPELRGFSRTSSVNKMEDDKMLTETVEVEGGKTELKRNGKKDERKASVEVSEVETEPKKRKRKKAKGEEDEPLANTVQEEAEEDEQSRESTKSKGRKRISTPVEQVENCVNDEKKKKKKKIKKEEEESPQESPQLDLVFLSEKTGNTDEVTINQERRHALQMEIDKASHPEKQAKPSGLGQWSTAQFSSSVQQQKFLRLMGGFKKGLQPPSAASSGGAQMAMGKDAQQQLHQGLLGEFERAHSRRMDLGNRGAGLGFTAPPNKKFSIDVNACRSVRFDD